MNEPEETKKPESIGIVCFKWEAAPGSPENKRFIANHVNALKYMVARHLSIPHKFYCVTDDPSGLDSDVSVVPMPDVFRNMQYCFPKIMIFSEECRQWFGEYFLFIDLDVVITNSIDSLIPTRGVDFVIHGKPVLFSLWELMWSKKLRRKRALYNSGIKYNSGMIYLRAGARAEVYNQFSQDAALNLREKFCMKGSDQLWIAYRLGFKEKMWSKSDGVYSYGSDLAGKKKTRLPDDARVVLFGGRFTPWQTEALQAAPWIPKHYPVGLLQ